MLGPLGVGNDHDLAQEIAATIDEVAFGRMQLRKLEGSVEHRLELTASNPLYQLLSLLTGAVGDAENLHLIKVDTGPHDLAQVAATGPGDGEPRIGGTHLHIADHGVDEQVSHRSANQVHYCINGRTIG